MKNLKREKMALESLPGLSIKELFNKKIKVKVILGTF